ncbi:MAG: transposase [Planctomycetaceae bacterium]|nr:transposase [Planctomycetaceae bacterium]
MTHQDECPAINDLTALLIEHGPAAMASALGTLMNHAMQIEREQVLQAESHQRTADRQGYANGFKPKTLKTRVGRLDLRIPQTRDYRDENGRPFYPRALERGVRSERAMTLAVAEMYVQGVSTRKVTAIVEELCGLEITSTQVIRPPLETCAPPPCFPILRPLPADGMMRPPDKEAAWMSPNGSVVIGAGLLA